MSINIPLLLFAKAPIVGQVKTRLQPHCTPEQCVEIAKTLLHESVKTISEHWPGKFYLSVWLDKEHDFIQTICEQYSVELTDQCEGDLGAKMQHAFSSFGYPAAIIGADVPHVKPQLNRAYRLLQQGESPIGVSEDGGYYFIGLSKPAPHLFNEMVWGNEQVLAETLSRAERANLELTPLDSLQDVDVWDDLLLAAKQLPPLAECLKKMDLI